MTYKEYLDKRKKLLAELNGLIDEGKTGEEFQNKKAEVEALDNEWDDITQAQADARALSDNQRQYNIQTLTDFSAEMSAGAGEVIARMNFGMPEASGSEETELYASEAYKNAWARQIMGLPLTAEERGIVDKVNEYTHTTANTGIVIPKTVASGIWDMIEELYPYWNDVQKTYVKGAYSALIGDNSTEAKWYDEETATEDGKETIRELALSGCELARSVTVSFKLREMAIEDFIPYIQRRLARKMGAGLGYGATHGKGKPTASEFKPEPLGVVTALEKEDGTPQIMVYKKNALSYKEITVARSKVKVGTNELAVYANSATIWGELANVVDGKGRPIFIPDPANNGIYRLFGMLVKEDDSMLDGEVLMSSPYVGYQANVNKEISVMTEEHVKTRTVDYCGYAIVDGGVTHTKAHALLKYADEASAAETTNGAKK